MWARRARVREPHSAAAGLPAMVAAAAVVRPTSATLPISLPAGCWWPAGAAAAAPTAKSLAAPAGMRTRQGEQADRRSALASKRCPEEAAAGPARRRWAGPAARAASCRISARELTARPVAVPRAARAAAGLAARTLGRAAAAEAAAITAAEAAADSFPTTVPRPAPAEAAVVPAIPAPRPARQSMTHRPA